MLDYHLSYTLDSKDHFCDLSETWDEFAKNNEGEDLLGTQLLGQSIWSSFRSLYLQGTYQTVFKAVRREISTISFPFRCDSPDLVRYMEIEFSAHQDRSIEVHTWERRVIRRDIPLEILNRNSKRNKNKVVVCSNCKKVQDSKFMWQDIDVKVAQLNPDESNHFPQIEHSICNECDTLILDAMKKRFPL